MGVSLVRGDIPCAVGALDEAYMWFIETSASLEVVEGAVQLAGEIVRLAAGAGVR